MTAVPNTYTDSRALVTADGFDPDTPSFSRVWPYLLGGNGAKDAYPADRVFADELCELVPGMDRVAWLRHAGRFALTYHLARSGIAQFIVAGTDLPVDDLEIHQVAWNANQAAHTVYADHDLHVVRFAEALLPAYGPCDAVQARPGDADGLLNAAAEHLDLGEPVAVLFVTSLGLLDDEAAAALVGGVTARVAPGSAVGIVDLGTTGGSAGRRAAVLLPALAAAHRAVIPRLRSHTEIAALLGPGLDLDEPGVADASTWFARFARPQIPGTMPGLVEGLRVWCAAARTPLAVASRRPRTAKVVRR